jgi:hypothetical protein
MIQQHSPHVAEYGTTVIYFMQKLQLHLSEVKDQFTMMKFAANHMHNLQQQEKLPEEIAILPSEIKHDKLYLIYGLLKALDEQRA